MQTFHESFAHAILKESRECHLSGNVDHYRFPFEAKPTVRQRLKRIAAALLARRGFTYGGPEVRDMTLAMSAVLERLDGFGSLWTLLADQRSRDLLVEVLTYRALGPQRVRLPRNTADYWSTCKRLDGLALERRTHAIQALDGWLNLYQVGQTRLHAHLLNVLLTFELQQYRHQQVAAKPGDVVIDGGGCYGDTALYFAERVGPSGQVACFEFSAENLSILRENLTLNPSLSSTILIRESALWDTAGETICFAGSGPGTSLTWQSDHSTRSVLTESIDSLNLPRVDFIKLDIEGAELRALRGAENILRRDRPMLAVAIYHSLDDFVTIPRFLNSLGLGYRFYLDHFTIHSEETVLFATV